ncbi:pheromone A receptor-domain-containing protein [Abortiporus biennis]|nr:pheromone A receptor-domain-containing protein [Abortiporus biennis]
MVSWKSEQPVITAFSFITFVLVSIPTWWLVDAGNVGGLLYIWWIATLNLIQFINTVIWKDNAVNYAPGWCDFVVRYNHIGSIGIIVAGLVVARRTCLLAHGSYALQTWQDKRREMFIDLAIGLSVPAIQLILYWFMQGHRFDILGGIGCVGAMPVSILYITLYSIWPIIIGFFSAVYSIRTLALLLHRRREIARLLATANSNLSPSRYFRLIVLCTGEILCTVPLAIYVMVVDIRHSYYPWKGFADLHYDFDRVGQYPTDLWLKTPQQQSYVEWQTWIIITLGLYFFAIFGFSGEAFKHYGKVIKALLKLVGLPSDLFQRKKDVDGVLFAHIPKSRRSLSTLSTIFTSTDQQYESVNPSLPQYHSDSEVTTHLIGEIHMDDMMLPGDNKLYSSVALSLSNHLDKDTGEHGVGLDAKDFIFW